MRYPKTQTLWKRMTQRPRMIIEGEYSLEEFGNVRRWSITEKIDGMNVRIVFNNNSIIPFILFRGRTNNAQMPKKLLSVLEDRFTEDNMRNRFSLAREAILFGEGYGAKIQKDGGKYRSDNAFILFDVVVDGIWLNRESVKEIADTFNIECVPEMGIMEEDDAVEYVKRKTQSAISEQPKIAEGVVARSEPLMLFRNGRPVMWKLKVRDFEETTK
jgi:ATP-dependent RNA circularization protein (DNA/RNA ligase family)